MKSTIIIRPKIREIMLARANAGYSSLDLAKAAGVHYTTIHAIESGRNKIILPKTAKRISTALGKSLQDLFEIETGREV